MTQGGEGLARLLKSSRLRQENIDLMTEGVQPEAASGRLQAITPMSTRESRVQRFAYAGQQTDVINPYLNTDRPIIERMDTPWTT